MLSPSPKKFQVNFADIDDVPKAIINKGVNFHMDFTTAASGQRQASVPLETEDNLLDAQDTYPN
jgi:hypothetical protein